MQLADLYVWFLSTLACIPILRKVFLNSHPFLSSAKYVRAIDAFLSGIGMNYA